MTATDLAQEYTFQPERCAPVPRITRRARSRAARALNDYCLVDEQGTPVGTIAAAYTRPRLGKNAPTLYLRRELEFSPRHSGSASL
jgi:hypothetical protein